MAEDRNYRAEIKAAADRGDTTTLVMLATELLAAAKHDAARREAEAAKKRRQRAASRDVPGQAGTEGDNAGQRGTGSSPLVPPPPSPAPSPSTPLNPPASRGGGAAPATEVLAVAAGTRPSRPSSAERPPRTAAPSALPKPVCDAAWEKWVATIGGVDYGLFRKKLAPTYQAQTAEHPTVEQLVAAIEAFSEGQQADQAAFRGKWTVHKWTAELPAWIRLGAMQWVDEWGIPTERGVLAGFFGRAVA